MKRYVSKFNQQCRDNVFIGSGVILDISSKIILDEHVVIAPGCLIMTHQNFGEFNGNILITICKTRYSPVHLCRNVVVGADTSILAGVTIGPYSVVGAKSKVNHEIPEKVLAF